MRTSEKLYFRIKLFLLVCFMLTNLFIIGCMSIQEAAREGNIDHIKTLLAFGANINGGTFLGDQGTALHRASGAGQVETVKFLIENGANVNIGNEASEIPLCYAAVNGHAEVVKILLENGGSVDGHGNKVPLVDAANNGHIEVAEILLSHGADINQKGRGGYTALNVAVASQPVQVEMIKFLLSRGADVNSKAAYDRTPLFTAATRGNIELVTLFLNAGAEANIMCNGRSTLMVAVGSDHVKMTELLLAHGANVMSNGRMALIASARNNNMIMTELLLAHGADVNAQDKYHNTPLYIAYCRENIEIGRILMEHGADPDLGRKIPQSFIEKLRK